VIVGEDKPYASWTSLVLAAAGLLVVEPKVLVCSSQAQQAVTISSGSYSL
jgi:hypothetical protein